MQKVYTHRIENITVIQMMNIKINVPLDAFTKCKKEIFVSISIMIFVNLIISLEDR